MNLEIHEFPPTRSNRALWALAEAGIDAARHRVNLPEGEHRQEAFRALNPLSYVPVLSIDGTPVIESAAIALFAAEMSPDANLVPKLGTVDRAQVYQWLVFAPAELDHRIAVVTQNTLLLPPDRRDPAAAQAAREALLPRLDLLEGVLKDRDYLVGSFSLADIAVGHSLAWATMGDLLRDHAGLRDYLARLMTRPGFRGVYGDTLEPMADPHAA